jgi:hypothetical protein
MRLADLNIYTSKDIQHHLAYLMGRFISVETRAMGLEKEWPGWPALPTQRLFSPLACYD